MSFGVRSRRIQTRQAYTIESLYEAVREKTFTAGRGPRDRTSPLPDRSGARSPGGRPAAVGNWWI